MKGAHIKCVCKFLLSACAQAANFQLTQFVGARLPWPTDVSIHFAVNVQLAQRGVGAHERHGLVAAPTQRVHASVHHKSA